MRDFPGVLRSLPCGWPGKREDSVQIAALIRERRIHARAEIFRKNFFRRLREKQFLDLFVNLYARSRSALSRKARHIIFRKYCGPFLRGKRRTRIHAKSNGVLPLKVKPRGVIHLMAAYPEVIKNAAEGNSPEVRYRGRKNDRMKNYFVFKFSEALRRKAIASDRGQSSADGWPSERGALKFQ